MSKSKTSFVFELRCFSLQIEDYENGESILQCGQIFTTWKAAKDSAQMDYFDTTEKKGKLRWAEVNDGCEWQAGDPEVWLYRISRVPVNCAFVR